MQLWIFETLPETWTMRQMPKSWVVALVLVGAAAIGGLTATHSQGPDLPRGAAGDVTAFGARGDAQTDDTTAVQRAVDSQAGTIRFPKGTYRLTRPVVIDLDRVGFTALVGDGTARILMAGPGPAFKFVGTHAGSADPAQMRENIWRNQRSPTVDGLEVVGGHPDA